MGHQSKQAGDDAAPSYVVQVTKSGVGLLGGARAAQQRGTHQHCQCTSATLKERYRRCRPHSPPLSTESRITE